MGMYDMAGRPVGDGSSEVAVDLSGAAWTLAVNPSTLISGVTSDEAVWGDGNIADDSVLSNHARWDGPAVTAANRYVMDVTESGALNRIGWGIGIGGDDWHIGWGLYRNGAGNTFFVSHYGDLDGTPTVVWDWVDNNNSVVRARLCFELSTDGKLEKSYVARYYDGSDNLLETRLVDLGDNEVALGANPKLRAWGYLPSGDPGGTRTPGYAINYTEVAL